jgi:pyridoxal 5'-phosphate synthase pdxT subunit
MTNNSQPRRLTIGILAIQGDFIEHVHALKSLRNDSLFIECVRVRTLNDLFIPNTMESGTTMLDSKLSTEKEEVQLIHELPLYGCLDALILPGGESTTMATLLEKERYPLDEDHQSTVTLLDILRHLIHHHRLPVWGTCAGAILLAEHVNHTKQGGQSILGGLDVTIERNAYGSQLDSFQANIHIHGVSNEHRLFPAVFIRAPMILDRLKEDVEVLAECKNPITPNGPSSIVAAREDMILATTFHPELTQDTRMHEYFLKMVSDRTEESLLELCYPPPSSGSCLLAKILKIHISNSSGIPISRIVL